MFGAIISLLAAAGMAQPPAGFALVVTNNRSLDAARPDLHYADDDGAQYAQLFSELLGENGVTLLTRFDADSARLQEDWAPKAVAPTTDALREAVDELARRIDTEQAAGRETDVYVVFAGHGDVRNGEGFIELEDAPLTARGFDEQVVARLKATRVHVVLDSCNSYFMLNPRQPGGKRWQVESQGTKNLLAQRPGVGALVATSAEQVTYEWSELQSGIFSYLVRSGLRGGADANADGRISYAELAAFIRVASGPVKNELYRPRLFMAAPAGDANTPVATLPAAHRRLSLPTEGTARITVRSPLGVRIADLHKENGTAASLVLPDGKLVLEERTQVDGRAVVHRFAIPDAGSVSLAELVRTPDHIAPRGEAPVFEALFSEPYGQASFAVAAASPPEPESAFGVGEKDLDRLAFHLRFASEEAYANRLTLGLSLFSMGAMLGTGGLAVTSMLNPKDQTLGYALSGGIGGMMILSGALSLGITSPEEDLYADFLKLDMSTTAARSQAVLQAERAFEKAAFDGKRSRRAGGALMYLDGILGTAFAAYEFGSDLHAGNGITWRGPLLLAASLTFVTFGWVTRNVLETSVERKWEVYRREAGLDDRPAPKPTDAQTSTTVLDPPPKPKEDTPLLRLVDVGIVPTTGGAVGAMTFEF